LRLQKRFFAHFLKGEGDWLEQPRVLLQVRHPGERFVERAENEWPLARTRWTELYLNPSTATLTWQQGGRDEKATYRSRSTGLTMMTAPFAATREITGPISCTLWASSSTEDADLFLVLRLFDPQGREVLFQGANDPRAPVAMGWLRASHRELDPFKSKPGRPYHPHLEPAHLEPGRVYELQAEIWPTCIVVPPRYRLALSVLGQDFDHGLSSSVMGSTGLVMRGAGPFLHDDPMDRPDRVFNNEVTIYSGPDRPSHLLLPVIPGRPKA
jgi:predicted acyl esterase